MDRQVPIRPDHKLTAYPATLPYWDSPLFSLDATPHTGLDGTGAPRGRL